MADPDREFSIVVKSSADGSTKSKPPLSQRLFDLPRIQLLLFGIALVVGLHGNRILRGAEKRPSPDGDELALGSPFLLLAIAIWLLAELIGSWPELRRWWQKQDSHSRLASLSRILPILVWISACVPLHEAMMSTGDTVAPLLQDAAIKIVSGGVIWLLIDAAVSRHSKHNLAKSFIALRRLLSVRRPLGAQPRHRKNRPFWSRFSRARLVLIGLAIAASQTVWTNTANNSFEPATIALWIVSGLLWTIAFAPANWDIGAWLTNTTDAWRRQRWRDYRWAAVAFIAIMIAGAFFRFGRLSELPREMYPDHADAIFDVYRIKQGHFDVMFVPRHDAREPLHYYLMAALSNLPGIGLNHDSLKLVAALESLLALPLMLWAGAELLGERDRRFGLALGLLVAGLVAVSYWHVVISRYALRTHLTAPFAALVLVFLARAVRHNRRWDYLACGLALGFSFYAYTASRLLPLVVVSAVAITLVIRRHSWRERMRYFINLAALAFVSFMIFLPMLRFAQDDPEHFWAQIAIHTSGNETIEEAADGIFSAENVSLLFNNLRNAWLAFYWQGDNDWIHAVRREPTMDVYASTFFVLGVAALAARMLKWRDPAHWMLPAAFICMLLPSALAFYVPWINPDNTRMNGAIPAAYAIAALPIAIIAFAMAKQLSGRAGKVAAVLFCGAVLALSAQRNWQVYFHDFAGKYAQSSQPFSELGAALRGFDESDGAYANAFVIGWGFSRTIAIESGASDPEAAQRNMRLHEVPGYIRSAITKSEPFQFRADLDLLFIFNPEVEEIAPTLRIWFPQGRELAGNRVRWQGV